MAEGIAGRRVIVTGGASGMGAAMVRDFARHGGAIVSLDWSEDAGRAVAEEAGVRFVRCDVSDEASVAAAFDEAVGALGGLDALVHAAGIAPGAPAESIALEEWDRVFAVNARGTFLANRAAFPHLRDGGGRILNFASGAGAAGYPGKAHYAATKGAVLAWTRTIAKEWGRYRITCNAIVPAIATPMYAKTRAGLSPEALAALDERLARDLPLGGALGDPDRDLAPVLRFLIGDGAGFITGQTIAIDGGLLMVR